VGGWSVARRILAVRFDALGGILMTTPALHALLAAGPAGRTVTLLTSSAGSLTGPLLEDVDDVIAYDPPWVTPLPPRPTPRPDLDMIERLRERDFDAAAVFTTYIQSPLPAALFCYLAGIPLRGAHCREDPRGLLTDRLPEIEPEVQVRHDVRRQLDLVAAVGVPAPDAPLRLSLPDGAADRARLLLEQAGVDQGEPWIVVHPGAGAPSRRYPAWSYADVLRRLVHEDQLQVVITGGPEELELAQDLAVGAGKGCVVLAGQTTLELLAAVISQAALLLSNNNGPVHLAAAFGVPVVDLYALTTPQRMPWLVPSRVLSHDVPCRWCYADVCPLGHHLCLRGVRPDEVVGAVRELLREPRV
jgi:lipopolysaccharide heptosyltransferase II